ncbi:D-psicose 3-epimerase [Lachnospiraceae bacterium LCP25S3_G4]
MKYGIYNAYWTKEWSSDYKHYIKKVKDLGFDILEISCAALQSDYTTDAQLMDLKKCAEDNGITLTAGYGPTQAENIASPDKAIERNAMKFYTELLPKLSKMDIKILGGGIYSYWPLDMGLQMDKEADTERSIKNIRILSKVAEDCDVTLGMEVLNRFEGYMLNTCEEAIRFVDAVDSTHVKIMLDTFHMNIEENNMAAAIRLAGDKLGHLHIGEQNRMVPGKGILPWAEIGQALREINYQGAAVMEPFVMSGGSIGRDIKVWRDLVPNPTEEQLDEDAKGSLQFVKHVFGM